MDMVRREKGGVFSANGANTLLPFRVDVTRETVLWCPGGMREHTHH